jgi:hypothetical protein
MSSEALKVNCIPERESPQALRNHANASFSAKLRFRLASILRLSERLADSMVSAYDRVFSLDEKDKADI